MSVYFYGCMTLDGYLADKNHCLDWLHQTGSTEDTGYEAFYQNMDITIMGRKTFREIENLPDGGSIYPTTKNFVFTHAESLPVKEYTPVNGNIVEFVRKLGTDKNIWIIGGNTILAPLLDADIVDQMIIQIAPVLLGGGIPLFTQKDTLKRFHLDAVKKHGQFAELIYSKR